MRQVYALLGLVKRRGPERVEAACARTLEAEAISVPLIGRMIERGTETGVTERPGQARPGLLALPATPATSPRPGPHQLRPPPMLLTKVRPSAPPWCGMSAPAPVISPELKALLRRLKLGRCCDTLPERLALARARNLAHVEFLELVLADESPAGRPPRPRSGPGPRGWIPTCALRTGMQPPRSPTTGRSSMSCAPCASSTPVTTP